MIGSYYQSHPALSRRSCPVRPVAFASFLLALLANCLAPLASEPVPNPGDRSPFSLFNPTPDRLLRGLSTDRPDITESPYTVDAGRFQVELSFVEYTRSTGADQYAVLPANLKLGLWRNLDLQLVVAPYNRIHPEEDDSLDGFGGLQVRSKINLWGNDEGKTALALMPYIRPPAAAEGLGSDRVEGGLIVPFGLELPAEWSLGLMVELDVVRNSDDDGYGIEFLHTVAVGREIMGPLGGYVEYIGLAPHRTGAGYQAAIGFGVTCELQPNVQLDAGTNLGISKDADDVKLFSGISFRL